MPCEPRAGGGSSFFDSRISLQPGSVSVDPNEEQRMQQDGTQPGCGQTSSVRRTRANNTGTEHTWKFLEAAYYQRMDILKDMLKQKKVDVNEEAPEDNSALHMRDDSTPYIRKGSTALHLTGLHEVASIEIARLLLAAKANVNQTDANGRTPLHVAAENDEAALVAILIEEGGDLSKEDLQGHNPLHTAIKSDGDENHGSVDAIKVMVGQGVDIEARTGMQQAQQRQPGGSDVLHLTPVQLATADNKTEIADYLEQRLHGVRNPQRSCYQRLQDAIYALSFWCMFIVLNSFFYLLLVPQIPTVGVYQLAYYVLLFVAASSHLASWNTDPGYLNYNEKEVRGYEQAVAAAAQETPKKQPPIGKDVVRGCPTCKVLKPRRSKHCTICRLCVDRFDHHCPWINNCVGRGNHRIFMVFLSSLMLLCIYMAANCAVAAAYDSRGAMPFIAVPFFPDSTHAQNTVGSEPLLVNYFGCGTTGSCPVHRWSVCAFGVMLLVVGVRVGCLWWEQSVRVSRNITTYEENSPWRFPYLSHRPGRDEEHPRLANDFERGNCCHNCLDFWNCCSYSGPSMGVENKVPYYMYAMVNELGLDDHGVIDVNPDQIWYQGALTDSQDDSPHARLLQAESEQVLSTRVG